MFASVMSNSAASVRIGKDIDRADETVVAKREEQNKVHAAVIDRIRPRLSKKRHAAATAGITPAMNAMKRSAKVSKITKSMR